MKETRCRDANLDSLEFLKSKNVSKSCDEFEENLYTINKRRKAIEASNNKILLD